MKREVDETHPKSLPPFETTFPARASWSFLSLVSSLDMRMYFECLRDLAASAWPSFESLACSSFLTSEITFSLKFLMRWKRS